MTALERTVRGLVRWLAEPSHTPTAGLHPAGSASAPHVERRFTVVEASGTERPPRRPGPPGWDEPPRPTRAA
ncbi:MAG: hypothetical protein M0029_11895 [Actinomycetota bacterium]|jgi:hypothetical protein|nr:hypothetical protein [Actinomycetota bacterium]